MRTSTGDCKFEEKRSETQTSLHLLSEIAVPESNSTMQQFGRELKSQVDGLAALISEAETEVCFGLSYLFESKLYSVLMFHCRILAIVNFM